MRNAIQTPSSTMHMQDIEIKINWNQTVEHTIT